MGLEWVCSWLRAPSALGLAHRALSAWPGLLLETRTHEAPASLTALAGAIPCVRDVLPSVLDLVEFLLLILAQTLPLSGSLP